MSVLSTCMTVPHMCAWYSQMSEGGIGPPGIGAMEGCELPCGGWASKPVPCKSIQDSWPLSYLSSRYPMYLNISNRNPSSHFSIPQSFVLAPSCASFIYFNITFIKYIFYICEIYKNMERFIVAQRPCSLCIVLVALFQFPYTGCHSECIELHLREASQ